MLKNSKIIFDFEPTLWDKNSIYSFFPEVKEMQYNVDILKCEDPTVVLNMIETSIQ